MKEKGGKGLAFCPDENSNTGTPKYEADGKTFNAGFLSVIYSYAYL
jgi:hypothetical protein